MPVENDQHTGELGTPRRAVRVLLVDDHHLFRAGMRGLLEEYGVDVVGEADSGEAALPLVARRRPDVVVMDLNMPGMSGVETIRRLTAAAASARVLVVTVSIAEDDVLEAVEAGAIGYLLKDAATEEIVRAISAAADGESVLSPVIARQLLERAKRPDVAQQSAARLRGVLSERELEVLRLVAEGKENSEIAAELFISSTTVKNHVSAILGKLDASNRVQAAIKAVRSGLL